MSAEAAAVESTAGTPTVSSPLRDSARNGVVAIIVLCLVVGFPLLTFTVFGDVVIAVEVGLVALVAAGVVLIAAMSRPSRSAHGTATS